MKNKDIYIMVDNQTYKLPLSSRSLIKDFKKQKIDVLVDKDFYYLLDFSKVDVEKEIEVLNNIIYLSKIAVQFEYDVYGDIDGFDRSVNSILGLTKDLYERKEYEKMIIIQKVIISELSLLYEKQHRIREKRYGY